MENKLQDFEIKRNSSVIFASALEKIRLIYPHDAELAGRFAIAYLEQLLTDCNSFEDDWQIQSNMTELVKSSDKNNEKYAARVEQTNSVKYDIAVRLAGYLEEGLKQVDMAKREGKSASWVSTRMQESKVLFPELFTKNLENSQNSEKFSEVQKIYESSQNFSEVQESSEDFSEVQKISFNF